MVSVQELADRIRAMHRPGAPDQQALLEAYLERELEALPTAERLVVLDELVRQFGHVTLDEKAKPELQSEEFSRLVSLLLGKKISIADLSSAELSRKLAQSLNTVFDTLNQIVAVINATLLGHREEQETIRQIIGLHIGGEAGDNSLQNYLDQVREAFLTAHKAFRQAAGSLMREMLTELDPEKMRASADSHLKFGPLRKAELFDLYSEKFRKIKALFESGRLMEEFLREFEKTCQKLYKTETRRMP
jgi:hypothetical protein